MAQAQHTLEEEDYHSHFDLSLWRKVLEFAGVYRGPLTGLAVCGVIFALVEATLPLVTGRLIDAATTRSSEATLVAYLGVYAAIVVVLPALIFLFINLAGRVITGMAHDIRREAFAKLQQLSFSYYDKQAVGWIMARLTSDCGRLSQIAPWFVLDLVWGTVFLIGAATIMLWLNASIALLVMTALPVLAIISVIFQRKLLSSQRMVRKKNSEITANFNEAIMGLRTTKSLVREKENLAEFQQHSTDMYGASVRNAVLSAVYLPLVTSLGSLGIGLALWRGGLDVQGGIDVGVGEAMSFGTLVAFIQYAAHFYMPIQEMAARFTELQAAQASAERIQSLLETEPEIRDSPEVIAAMGGQGDQDRSASTVSGGKLDEIREIEFKDVSFSYKPGEPVLKDFNLRVRVGESTALVGATGSGKTTLVNLLARFYEPTAGQIRLDGVDYRDQSLHWLQAGLGIVLQTPHLFSGTVRENIRYGRLSASDQEVEEAARLANAEGFIQEMDGGYDAEVGERGDRLSMGQKQLISLARAILARPRIFIMDEATSSVDTETEGLIQKAIERILKGRFSFIIAHRLSTIRSADRILVMDSGRLMEEGSHDELLRRRGRYYRLYMNQFTRERQEEVLRGDGVGR